MKSIDFFNTTDFADILNRDEKELIINNSTLITYNKGDCLVKTGEYVTDAVFIWSGYVKIHLEFTRRSMIFNILGPKRFVLLDYMISDEVQPFNITAIDETSAFLIEIKVVRDLAQNNPRFSFYLLQRMSKTTLNYITHNLVSLTQNNIHGRLANIILYLSENVFQSTSFDLLLSRKELSELCNISRENVIKVLYEFDTDGIIQLRGKSIHINSLENLRRIANHG